jgi:hypothetical protein
MALPLLLTTFVIGMSLGRFVMRLTSLVTLSAAALLLSSTAMAQDKKLAANEQPQASTAYQASTDQPAASRAPAEKKICKRLATSGTRMAKTSCLTKEQWEKVQEESR